MPVELRRAASEHLIDVLADLHAVDVDAVGLGDLARRDGYVERQVKRWTTQWENSKTRELPAIDEVGRTARASGCPSSTASSIAHGDYRFGNCLTDRRAGRIAAVLDWELCTLGDPLADVGYLGVYWSDPAGRTAGPTTRPGREGFPTYDELLERYARADGPRPLRHRLLRGVLVVAAGGDLRGRLRPLPARRDGRSAVTSRRSTGSRPATEVLAESALDGDAAAGVSGADRGVRGLGARIVHGRRHHPRHLPQGHGPGRGRRPRDPGDHAAGRGVRRRGRRRRVHGGDAVAARHTRARSRAAPYIARSMRCGCASPASSPSGR